ncbi:MAG: ATP-binding protein [Bdellovibrionota bacterium]
MTDLGGQEQHVLILTPVGKDAVLARQVLESGGIGAVICGSMGDLVSKLQEGFGAILLAEETLDPVSTRQLSGALKAQPPWSDIPIVLLTSRGEASEAGLRIWNTFAAGGNVTIHERPVRTHTLISALQVSLRSRRRQYQVRKLLLEQEEATRLRDEFISIASHELRTPITSLKLQTQLTRRTLSQDGMSQLPLDRLGKFFRNTDIQISRLSRLVEDMLDVSRINIGKFMVNREEFDLEIVIREVVDQFSSQLASSGNRVEISVGPCVGRWDRYRLEQVLNNLITNAIRYAPGALIRIVVEQCSDRVRIIFCDEGPGIAKEKVSKIFDRFERATTGFGITGLGLGLYICRQIVEAHGGTIQAESDTGSGVRFVLELPRFEAASPPLEMASPAS